MYSIFKLYNTWSLDRIIDYKAVSPLLATKSKNLNKELWFAGLAWHYKRYSRDPALAKLEFEVRAAKRGLWAEIDPVAPREWRRKRSWPLSTQILFRTI